MNKWKILGLLIISMSLFFANFDVHATNLPYKIKISNSKKNIKLTNTSLKLKESKKINIKTTSKRQNKNQTQKNRQLTKSSKPNLTHTKTIKAKQNLPKTKINYTKYKPKAKHLNNISKKTDIQKTVLNNSSRVRLVNSSPKNKKTIKYIIPNPINYKSQNFKNSNSKSWFNGNANKNLNMRRGLTANNLRQNAILTSNRNKPNNKPRPKINSNEYNSKKADVLNFSYKKDVSAWSPNTAKPKVTPDESLVLDGEHHVRAFTKLDNSDDFDISAGPELILKERKQNTTLNKTNQPKSELGVGMHFEYKF